MIIGKGMLASMVIGFLLRLRGSRNLSRGGGRIV